jgi:hypothetical protein
MWPTAHIVGRARGRRAGARQLHACAVPRSERAQPVVRPRRTGGQVFLPYQDPAHPGLESSAGDAHRF